MALLVAMTIPGLAIALVVLAAMDRLALWAQGRSWLPWYRSRRHRGVSSTAFDELHAQLSAGKRQQVEQRKTEQMRRDDAGDAAAPRTRVDLDNRSAVIYLPTADDL